LSDLAMYEALASTALRIHGRDSRRLRKAIAAFELERGHAKSDECRAGFDLVLRKLRERLGQFELPLDRERGG
jgi:hypothetical protein